MPVTFEQATANCSKLGAFMWAPKTRSDFTIVPVNWTNTWTGWNIRDREENSLYYNALDDDWVLNATDQMWSQMWIEGRQSVSYKIKNCVQYLVKREGGNPGLIKEACDYPLSYICQKGNMYDLLCSMMFIQCT